MSSFTQRFLYYASNAKYTKRIMYVGGYSTASTTSSTATTLSGTASVAAS